MLLALKVMFVRDKRIEGEQTGQMILESSAADKGSCMDGTGVLPKMMAVRTQLARKSR